MNFCYSHFKKSALSVPEHKNRGGTEDNVRLWRVHRCGGVADVLCALKHSERQAGQEVSRRQQSGDWPQLKTCPFYGNTGRDIIIIFSTVLHQRHHWEQPVQFLSNTDKHIPPIHQQNKNHKKMLYGEVFFLPLLIYEY